MADDQIETINKIFWSIEDLSEKEIKSYKVGKEIVSKPFEIAIGDIISKWTLLFYPNGENLRSKSHIAVFLNLSKSTSLSFDACFKLGIMNEAKEETFFIEKHRTGDELTSEAWGFRSVHHDKLFDLENKFFVDNKLTLACKLTLTRSEVTSIKTITNLNDNLASDFKKMFENKCFSDLELISKDGDPIKAHKVILAARSPVIFAMLDMKMEEAEKGSVNIPDFGTKTLKELLRFIYCNEVEDIDGIARELIFAAEKYDLEPLKKLCSESIIKSLTIENVAGYLLLSDRLNKTKNLFDKCLDFIVANYHLVSKTPDWKNLSNNVMTKIVDRTINRRSRSNDINTILI